MSYPAGRLPQSDEIAQARNSGTAIQSLAFAPGADVDLTALPIGFCTRFLCTTAGNLVAQFPLDAAPQTYPVTVGQTLACMFTLVKGTSTASGILLKT